MKNSLEELSRLIPMLVDKPTEVIDRKNGDLGKEEIGENEGVFSKISTEYSSPDLPKKHLLEDKEPDTYITRRKKIDYIPATKERIKTTEIPSLVLELYSFLDYKTKPSKNLQYTNSINKEIYSVLSLKTKYISKPKI